VKLSRIAVLFAAAAVVLAPVQPAAAASAQAGWNEAVIVAPAIFEDPFGFAPANFPDKWEAAPTIFTDKWEAASAIFADKWEGASAIFADPLGFVTIGHGQG
jgi:hypothetical protein